MAMGNWESNDWWNRPQGEQQRTTPPVTDSSAELEKQENKLHPAVEAVQQIARTTVSQMTHDYAKWAQERQQEYVKASEQFLQDKQLAPYYNIAKQYFYEQDQLTGQQIPVSQLLDRTKHHIAQLQQMGVKPPEPPKRPQSGFPPATQGWDIPLQEQQSNPLGLKPVDYKEQEQKNHDYLFQRRLDLDLRKAGPKADVSDLKEIERLRTEQYKNNTYELEKI